MIGVTGKVCVVNTRVYHAKPKVEEGGMKAWDGLPGIRVQGGGIHHED